MENSKKSNSNKYYTENSVEMFEELFNLSKSLKEMNQTMVKKLEQINADPVTFLYQQK
ncbi:hypothetical protein DYBT9275_02409 [Dyadobacter sp. CECT 9275]|uniref:Uncharacterized protein n=1 Tax=Dyadobacter helix TaxID=2822344 RepID=A0A916JBR8_9BACT|nr:hypothetical protein [Dyadobacter sp. CECT 9275]CAG5000178.1 hypothetical protein DYBT9275_02409 [Dyadobacter sp. CECT 9275]